MKFNQSKEKSEKLNGGEQKLSNGDLPDVEVAGNDDPERAAWEIGRASCRERV